MEPTRFDRVMFATLVPATILPLGGSIAMFALSLNAGMDLLRVVGGLAATVLLLVALGSMAFNAWVLLRRARTWQTRSIPRRVGQALLALYVTLVLWFLLLLIPDSSVVPWFLLFGAATAVESIVVLALIRAASPTREKGVSELTLGPLARRWVTAYLVVAVLGLAYSVVLAAFPTSADRTLYSIPMAVILGLPWSPVPTFVAFIYLIVGSSIDLGSPFSAPYTVLTLPLVVNIALAVGLLGPPRCQATALRVLFFQRRVRY